MYCIVIYLIPDQIPDPSSYIWVQNRADVSVGAAMIRESARFHLHSNGGRARGYLTYSTATSHTRRMARTGAVENFIWYRGSAAFSPSPPSSFLLSLHQSFSTALDKANYHPAHHLSPAWRGSTKHPERDQTSYHRLRSGSKRNTKTTSAVNRLIGKETRKKTHKMVLEGYHFAKMFEIT